MSGLVEDVARPQGASTASAMSSAAAVRVLGSAPVGWQRCIPAILICLTLVRHRVLMLFSALPLNDFMTYWAAGRLFLSGSNPYSSTSMFAIERSLSWSYAQPLIMLNPPWTLPLIALLGVLPFETAHVAWVGVSLVLEAISSVALWRYFGGEKRTQWMGLVLFATFLPMGSAEHMGQITPMMLAGLTAFLFALRRRHYLLAGVCLLTLGLKPHLLYLVVLAIVLWTGQNIREKKWRLAVGAVVAYAGATLGAMLFNRNVLGYFHGTLHAAMDTSCGVGGVLRATFGMEHMWLQFLPTAVGTAWFARYWMRHRHEWTWEEHLPLVLLVSLCTAPYFWAHDFVLAMPALAALAVRMSRTRTDWLVPSALYLVVQIVIFTEAELLSKAWMATASLLWLVLYCAGMLYVRHEESAVGAGRCNAV
ncbi:MAG TPA: glycosyltransferase family 87 protein [Acidobacteriaceae bacterium]